MGEARRTATPRARRELAEQSRALGEEEAALDAEAVAAQAEVRELLLWLPNLPSPDAPDGEGEADNVEVRRWPDTARTYAEHQRVPHWDVGAALGILDLERGAKLSGSMFPLYRGMGARLIRALTAFALDHHADAYEEIRPPTLVRTETMVSTGHLPKFADDAYHLERDDLWAIPTAEVPAHLDVPRRDPRRGRPPDAPDGRHGLLPARGGLGRARHPGPAARARVRQGRALRLRHRRAVADRARRPWSGGPRRCCRSSTSSTASSTCARASSATPRPAPSTSRSTPRGATCGSRCPR